MRYISIILCLWTFNFSEDFLDSFSTNDKNNYSDTRSGFFERFYIFGSAYNYKSSKNLNLKENSAGINLVKTLNLPFGDNKVKVDGKAIFDNYTKGSEKVLAFNELYMVTKINDIEFDIGRKYVDFSIAKTYTLLDFISKPLTVMDSDDGEISKQGKDGVAFGYTPSWLQGAEMFFYAYTDGFSSKSSKSEELLIELRLNNQFVKARGYSFLDDKDKSSLAGSIIANVNRDVDIYGEIRYRDSENPDYILGIGYEAYKNVSIRVERAILNSGSTHDELVKKFDGNGSKLINHYNNGLSGNNYINAFVKYSFPDYPSSVYLSAVKNMGDESARVSAKVDYLQGRVKYYAQIIRSLGDENSELYYREDTKIIFNISLNLTDEIAQPLNMK